MLCGSSRTTEPGMLAPSPADFYNSSKIRRHPFPYKSRPRYGAYVPPPMIVNRGLRLEMPLFGRSESGFLTKCLLEAVNSGELSMHELRREPFLLAVIPCSFEGERNYLGVHLLNHSIHGGSMHYGRFATMVSISEDALFKSSYTMIHIDSHWIPDWCLPES